MTRRVATALLFVSLGAIVGTWIALIPAIQRSLGASGTEMGFVLLAAAAGALVSFQVTGQVLARVPSDRIVRGLSLLLPLVAPLPLLASTPASLALVMLVFGAVQGAVDVALNAHGVALERAERRPLMSSLHAGWSIGGMLGATVVAVATALLVEPLLVVGALAAGLWVLALVSGRSIGSGSMSTGGGRGLHLPSRQVLPIGVLAVLFAFVEGGMNDWTGIYLRRDLGAPPEVAAAAYAALTLGMTIGRVFGDALNMRLGPIGLFRVGALLVVVSLAAVLAVGEPLLALAGLVVAGVGVANGLPLLFAAGGRVPPAGPSLSAVFTMTYLAFLGGPLLIGVISDTFSLAAAIALLATVSLATALGAGRVSGLERPASWAEPVGDRSAA